MAAIVQRPPPASGRRARHVEEQRAEGAEQQHVHRLRADALA